MSLAKSITVSILILILTAFLGARAAKAEGVTHKRPNILYVFSDMERANSLGCYGVKEARTPNFDSLASDGLRLSACISTTPVCCPYRATLLSGQYAHHNNMMSNEGDFKPTVKCLAETFKEAGYETGYVGKWHLGRANDPNDPSYGFPPPGTEYGVYHFKRDPAPTTDIALKFISEKSKGDAPWLLFVSWIWPHSPYKAPEDTLRDFPQVTIPPNVPAGVSQDYAKRALPNYYGMIEALDFQFARLLKALDKAGVADDTIVIFTSDHGDMIGSQGYKGKRWPYEESIRVPFLIRYPKSIAPGRVLTAPFGTPDIYPTLAGLAGVKAPAGLDGADFSRYFTGEDRNPPRDYVYMEMAYAYVPWPGWRGFRTHDYMYARTADKPWVMYNVASDPYETNNLVNVSSEKPRVKQMDARLAELMKRYGDTWDMKTSAGDVQKWVPGGPKQQVQTLGVAYPGRAPELAKLKPSATLKGQKKSQ
ncbi:MAG TPA: sulfatase [Verrucomicrobiae bacterium]|nr:sulfatase [Verrucomicrobiae bacterium]